MFAIDGFTFGYFRMKDPYHNLGVMHRGKATSKIREAGENRRTDGRI